jgi:hypothetical protein
MLGARHRILGLGFGLYVSGIADGLLCPMHSFTHIFTHSFRDESAVGVRGWVLKTTQLAMRRHDVVETGPRCPDLHFEIAVRMGSLRERFDVNWAR